MPIHTNPTPAMLAARERFTQMKREQSAAIRSAVLNALSASNGLTQRAIVEATGFSPETVKKHLLNLIDDGIAVRERAIHYTTPRAPFIYSLVAQTPASVTYLSASTPDVEEPDGDHEFFWLVDLPVPLNDGRFLLQDGDGVFFVATPVAVIG